VVAPIPGRGSSNLLFRTKHSQLIVDAFLFEEAQELVLES
jgi:hypothetical protein